MQNLRQPASVQKMARPRATLHDTAPSPRPSPPMGERVSEGRGRGMRVASWSHARSTYRGGFHEPPESPQGFGVRWLAGNGTDTALEFKAPVRAKAVCALAPHPPHSKTLLRDAVLGPNAGPMFG